MKAGRAAESRTTAAGPVQQRTADSPNRSAHRPRSECRRAIRETLFLHGRIQIAGGDLPMAAQQLQLALANSNLTQSNAPASSETGRSARISAELAPAQSQQHAVTPRSTEHTAIVPFSGPLSKGAGR